MRKYFTASLVILVFFALSYAAGKKLPETSGSEEQKALAFIRGIMGEEFRPPELKLELLRKGEEGRGDEYASGWEAGLQNFNIFYVTWPKSKEFAYLRVDMLVVGEEATQEKARNLLSEIFSQEFLAEFDELECAEREDPFMEKLINICSRLKKSEDSLEGITIRGPMQLPEGPRGVHLSACLIPPEGAPLYTYSFCI